MLKIIVGMGVNNVLQRGGGMAGMVLWKINCNENEFPGMWHRFYRHQCVAVGWPSNRYRLNGKLDNKQRYNDGWMKARKALKDIEKGDWIVVSLHGNRVGRLGQVTEIRCCDDQWEPLVRESKKHPDGEMGRRICVRWDLTCGPEDRDWVVHLPEGSQFSQRRLTISKVTKPSLEKLRDVMNNSDNWVGLWSGFRHESALSDYIAAYPNRLEDGMTQYPDAKVREQVVANGKRVDVLLLDRENRPVVVECKQGAPTVKHIGQIRGYMRPVKKLVKGATRGRVRGILVHGGSRKLDDKVVKASKGRNPVEIVQHVLRVDFVSSGGR